MLPESLGELTALRKLDVAGNNLTGALPRSLTTLPLAEFRYGDTQLCVPHEEEFQDWLETIGQHEGTGRNCAPMAEREALVALFEATGGPNWTSSENWLTNAPLSSWQGVDVGSNGQVTQLDLGYNGLQGSIPAAIGSLSGLQYLNLNGNWGLSGPLPPEFFDLKDLQQLYLYAVGLAGPLPPEIGKLTELRTVDMRRTGLGGPLPVALGNLVNLSTLRLAGNDLIGPIPPELGQLTRLRSLSLWGNEFTGEIPPELGNLKSLLVLDLERNQLTGSIPSEFGKLGRLEVLWLNDNALTGAPFRPPWESMRSMERMYLHANELDGALPAELRRVDPNCDTSGSATTRGCPGPCQTAWRPSASSRPSRRGARVSAHRPIRTCWRGLTVSSFSAWPAARAGQRSISPSRFSRESSRCHSWPASRPFCVCLSPRHKPTGSASRRCAPPSTTAKR